MKKLSMIFAMTFILIFCFENIYSQNASDALRLSEPGIFGNARSLGLGNAYISISNDLSASLFNPAGLGLIKKFEIEGTIGSNSFNNDVTFFNRSVSSSSSKTNLTELGAVFPVPTTQGSLVFALGFNQLKDFNRTVQFDGYNPANNSYIQYLYNYGSNNELDFLYNLGLIYTDANQVDKTNITGRLNQKGSITQDGRMNSWYISGSVEAEKNIFIGATIDVISGTYRKNWDYWEEDRLNNYPNSFMLDPKDSRTSGFNAFHINTITDWDIAGWDAKLGILAKLDNGLNIGATIQFPRSFTIKETYAVNGQSFFINQSFEDWLPTDKIEYDIRTPYEFTFGASFTKRLLTVSVDAKIIDYSTMEFTSGFNSYNRADENSYIKTAFRTVVNLNGGVEIKIPNSGLSLRAGTMLMPSAYKDDPKDFDKKYVTAGIGYNVGKSTSVSFAYVYGWWKDYGDNYDVNISRTLQDVKTNNMVFSLKYNL